MHILRIEHPVTDFDTWKKAFDSDPAGRQKAGVRRHRILRSVDEPNFVTIDLEFDGVRQATALLEALRPIWNRVQGQIITGPRGRIFEVAEVREY